MDLLPNPVLSLLSLTLLVGTSAVAQSVAVDLTANSTLHCASAVTGGAPDQRSLPPGPLLVGGATAGNLGAFSMSSAQTQALAAISWSRGATSTSAHAVLNTSASVTTGAGGVAAVDPQDLEVAFTATAPSAVRCKVTLLREFSPGAPTPRIDLDFDADGNVDVFNLQAGLPAVFVAQDIQATPLRLRVLVESVSLTGGYSDSMLTVEVVPADPIHVATVAPGCVGGNFVSPLFGNAGVLLRASLQPTVAVLGFGQQPQLLPGPTPNCFLIPTPDIALLLTPGSDVVVPLPASLRPLIFFTQKVIVAGQLFTLDASSVFAW